jgi:hypothetical protein
MERVLVNRAEFSEVLARIASQGKTAETANVSVTCEDNSLLFCLPGIELRAAAQGNWHGQVLLPVRTLISLASAPLPDGDPLVLSVEGNTLHLGTLRLSCRWEPTPRKLIELPLNPQLRTLLRIPIAYSEDDIRRSGLSEVITKALQEKDEVAEQACGILKPLGVRPDDLRRLVEESIRRED